MSWGAEKVEKSLECIMKKLDILSKELYKVGSTEKNSMWCVRPLAQASGQPPKFKLSDTLSCIHKKLNFIWIYCEKRSQAGDWDSGVGTWGGACEVWGAAEVEKSLECIMKKLDILRNGLRTVGKKEKDSMWRRVCNDGVSSGSSPPKVRKERPNSMTPSGTQVMLKNKWTDDLGQNFTQFELGVVRRDGTRQAGSTLVEFRGRDPSYIPSNLLEVQSK